MDKKHDYPFDDVIPEARMHAAHGRLLFQKYTCTKCGTRLTMDEPNRFWMEGTCDQPQCVGVVTNIAEQGCNYLLVQSSEPEEYCRIMGIEMPPDRDITICLPKGYKGKYAPSKQPADQ